MNYVGERIIHAHEKICCEIQTYIITKPINMNCGMRWCLLSWWRNAYENQTNGYERS